MVHYYLQIFFFTFRITACPLCRQRLMKRHHGPLHLQAEDVSGDLDTNGKSSDTSAEMSGVQKEASTIASKDQKDAVEPMTQPDNVSVAIPLATLCSPIGIKQTSNDIIVNKNSDDLPLVQQNVDVNATGDSSQNISDKCSGGNAIAKNSGVHVQPRDQNKSKGGQPTSYGIVIHQKSVNVPDDKPISIGPTILPLASKNQTKRLVSNMNSGNVAAKQIPGCSNINLVKQHVGGGKENVKSMSTC